MNEKDNRIHISGNLTFDNKGAVWLSFTSQKGFHGTLKITDSSIVDKLKAMIDEPLMIHD